MISNVLHFFLCQRYDRTWTPYNSIDWKMVNTSLTINQGAPSFNFLPLPPSTVMRTTSIPANFSDNIEFHFLPKYNASRYYVYMYFAEIQKLEANQIREFNIFVNGKLLNNDPLIPLYLQSMYYISVIDENKLELWFNKTSRSTLPPLFNAIEIYMTKDFLQSETYQTDVDAILNVNYAESNSPRIVYLNLTSSGLIGNIAPAISNLKSIEYLDLSNNSLTGAVPDFLSQLRFLRVLNLEGNQLSGAIPIQLLVRSENSTLKSNFGGNPNLCTSGSCNKMNKVVVPLVASLGGAFMILAVAMISFRIYYKRHQVSHHVSKMGGYSRIKQELENFEKVVGKGASGTVYHGWIDHDTEVAVKMLSSESVQGYMQFQAEAKLFAVVHHKYLTGLIGYCDDGTNMALIYEYMANGDLAKHLSDKSEHILSWNQRLQIAVDAAEGLEYLHHGCNPPIVHRDVKSKNILLNEKFQGKLADFGLSKIFPRIPRPRVQ
ncbi:Leucine-rich repeat transmembrane protein kinase protein [Trifolium repens]|nr:Leucine-rich repeat transmembrane protein kinase protein [Trifolium repens]